MLALDPSVDGFGAAVLRCASACKEGTPSRQTSRSCMLGSQALG